MFFYLHTTIVTEIQVHCLLYVCIVTRNQVIKQGRTKLKMCSIITLMFYQNPVTRFLFLLNPPVHFVNFRRNLLSLLIHQVMYLIMSCGSKTIFIFCSECNNQVNWNTIISVTITIVTWIHSFCKSNGSNAIKINHFQSRRINIVKKLKLIPCNVSSLPIDVPPIPDWKEYCPLTSHRCAAERTTAHWRHCTGATLNHSPGCNTSIQITE